MKLHGVIDLHVSGERVMRAPGFWDRLVQRFGGEPELQTGRMRAALEATAVVDAVRQALSRLGATNAISLVIDDQVLFQDRDGKPDDLGDLFLAFHDNESVFGAGFQLLRLAVEHEEAGLHMVLEVVAESEHPAEEPAARVAVAGRIRAFEPRSGEDAEAYRARVEPLTADPSTVNLASRQFESFVARVADAMRAAMPEARVEVRSAEAQVERPPSARERRDRRDEAPAPTDPRYDPYAAYYGHPLDGVMSMMMWTSLLHWSMVPNVVVVNHQGDPIGNSADAQAGHLSGGEETADGGDGDGGFGDGGGDFGDGGGDFGGGDGGD